MPETFTFEEAAPEAFSFEEANDSLPEAVQVTTPSDVPAESKAPLQVQRKAKLESELESVRGQDTLARGIIEPLLKAEPAPSKLFAGLASPIGLPIKARDPERMVEPGFLDKTLETISEPLNLPLIPAAEIPGVGAAMSLYFGVPAAGQGIGEAAAGITERDPDLLFEGLNQAALGGVMMRGGVRGNVKLPRAFEEANKEIDVESKVEPEKSVEPTPDPLATPEHRNEPPAELKPVLEREGAIYIGKMEYEEGKGAHLVEIYDPKKDPTGQHGASIGLPFDLTEDQIAKKIADKREAFGWEKPKAEPDKAALLREADEIGNQPELTDKHVERLKEIADQLKPPVKDVPAKQETETKLPSEPAKQQSVIAKLTDPVHGLPKGVPDRGPTFAANLMEASRRLGALARSKLTLRPGILGVYARHLEGDKIYMGDIRNQRTMSHEIGHALDAILFGRDEMGTSQASLVTRLGGGDKEVLYNELKGVSELMRGPVDSAYRKRAVELIADWFSLYAHDPQRARAMAPKWSKGFEDALEKDLETKETVDQLLSGNVEPVAPEAAAGSQIPSPTALPGKIPARPTAAKLAPERELALAGEGLVKGTVRKYEAEAAAARVLGDKWREQVPTSGARNDVGAFVEGIGNLEIPGDSIESVTKRMTSAMKELAKEYRYRVELARQEINRYLKDMDQGEYLKFLEDYLGHFYQGSKKQIQSALGRFSKESPHANERKVPTLKEAVDLGLRPLTQDPATTYEVTARTNWRVATNRKFVAEMRKLTTLSGEPAVVPKRDAPPGWPTSNNPLIQRVYARQSPKGLLLWRGGAAIHPDLWRAAKQILYDPTSTWAGRAYDAVNSMLRATAFALSGFHDVNLRFGEVGIAMRMSNPARGIARVLERDMVTGERQAVQSTREAGKELLKSEEAVRDAAMHGVKFAWGESESYERRASDSLGRIAARLRDVPYLGKAARIARDLQQMRQKGLWRNTHDAFKIVAYHDLVSKALQDSPETTNPKLVKEQIASLTNDVFGGQEWQTQFWLDPTMRKIWFRFMLAPDWTISTAKTIPLGHGAEPNLQRLRFWGGEVAAVATATIVAQYAIYHAFGKKEQGDQPWVWNNELDNRYTVDVTPIMRQMPWHDPNDKTRHYMNLGKRAAEIVRYVTNPMANVEAKLSRPAAEVLRQVTGMEGDFKMPWKRDHESFAESVPERLKSLGSELLPFTFSASQFALTVPMRKGMTKFKAQEAFESLYEVAANPSVIRSILRGQPLGENHVNSMESQILEAASANGVNAIPIRTKALSVVRGHHYDLFFKALQKGDEKTMNTEGEALSRLGATRRGLEESLKRKLSTESP